MNRTRSAWAHCFALGLFLLFVGTSVETDAEASKRIAGAITRSDDEPERSLRDHLRSQGCVVSLGLVAVVVLIIVASLSAASTIRRTTREKGLLRDRGRVIDALITGIDDVTNYKDKVIGCDVSYYFTTEEYGPDKEFEGSDMVDEDYRLPMLIGKRARIRYLPSDPSISRLEKLPD